MALNMEAMLRLVTTVDGMQAVKQLNTKLGGLQNTARGARGGLDQMAQGGRQLLNPIRALVPAVGAIGLASLAKNAIDTGDELQKMSERTGANVGTLDQFRQAANESDSSLDQVGYGLMRLSQSMIKAQDETSKEAQLFRELGVAVTDANGELRPTEQVMLDVATAFSNMEDGGKKTEIAMGLMKRAGQGLIPTLNLGREGIEGFNQQFSEEFTNRAAGFQDTVTRLESAFGQLAIQLLEGGLLESLESLAGTAVMLVEGFNNLPQPIQTVVGGLILFGPVIGPLIKIFGGLIAVIKSVGVAVAGVKLGAKIAAWLPGVAAALGKIGAAIAAFGKAALAIFSGPVGWTVLAVAAVVAMAIAFRKPITDFFSWLGGAIANGLNALWQWGEPIRQFWSGIWEGIKGFATGYFTWLAGTVTAGFQAIMRLAYQLFVEPWVSLWENVLRPPVTAMYEWFQGVWQGIGQFFKDAVVTPIQSAWQGLTKFLGDAVSNVAQVIQGAWTTMTGGVAAVLRGVLQAGANMINSIIRALNGLIQRVNQVRNALGMSSIGLVGEISVPAFAQGGVVDRKTLAMVGEGGEREYIVPESKMAAASARYLAGARGADVIPTTGGSMPRSGGAQAPVVNITTGPVMEFDGKRYVRMEDFERGMRQVADGVIGRLRTPSARIALGRV